MNAILFCLERAVIVRNISSHVDRSDHLCFQTRRGQEICIRAERLSIEVHPEIVRETMEVLLDLLGKNDPTISVAILAASKEETLIALFEDSGIPFPGLRCALATPA